MNRQKRLDYEEEAEGAGFKEIIIIIQNRFDCWMATHFFYPLAPLAFVPLIRRVCMPKGADC